MKKFIDYIIRNILHIIANILASIFFVFLILPILVNLEFVKNFLNETSKKTFIGITSIVLLFIIYSWKQAKNLWQRCKNTYGLENPPFIYPYHIIIFIIFSSVLVALLQNKSLIHISLEFRIFVGLNFVFIVAWFLSGYFWKEKKKEERASNIDIHSLSDEPIQFDEQDLLGRKKFVEDLYKEIVNLPFSDSFVFGLYGSWGEGKTSVINLLRNKFKGNEDFLVVNFDPWYFKNEEAILTAFYKQVEQTINQKFIFSDLKKTFTRYQNMISSGLSQAGIKIDFLHIDESLDELRRRIESYIIQTKKKILIFLDDIDRLNPEEILLIFKLVRLNTKFKNTIFILSFDENYVSDVLEEKWATNGSINKESINLIHTRSPHVF